MGTRALVLGGGGVTGVAWELGLITGLAEAGVDLSGADLVIGTSAGAVVGAQILSGMPIADLFKGQHLGRVGEIPAKMPMRTSVAIGVAMLRPGRPEQFRRRVGELALATETVPEADRRAVIEQRLPRHEWPERLLRITAVDAETGEFVVFDRDSGVSLVDAVGASCAVPGVWPPVTIGGRRFMDGGLRSAANADLAEGADRIVVIAPITHGGGPSPRPADQVKALAERAEVVLVTPDRASDDAIGTNPLDPARRAPAAAAGRRQAATVVSGVRATWGEVAG